MSTSRSRSWSWSERKAGPWGPGPVAPVGPSPSQSRTLSDHCLGLKMNVILLDALLHVLYYYIYIFSFWVLNKIKNHLLRATKSIMGPRDVSPERKPCFWGRMLLPVRGASTAAPRDDRGWGEALASWGLGRAKLPGSCRLPCVIICLMKPKRCLCPLGVLCEVWPPGLDCSPQGGCVCAHRGWGLVHAPPPSLRIRV